MTSTDLCNICNEANDKSIVNYKCEHKCHAECIERWFTDSEKSSKCPHCSESISKEKINSIQKFNALANAAESLYNIKDKDEQLNAMGKFTKGQMSYAEMRMMCG